MAFTCPRAFLGTDGNRRPACRSQPRQGLQTAVEPSDRQFWTDGLDPVERPFTQKRNAADTAMTWRSARLTEARTTTIARPATGSFPSRGGGGPCPPASGAAGRSRRQTAFRYRLISGIEFTSTGDGGARDIHVLGAGAEGTVRLCVSPWGECVAVKSIFKARPKAPQASLHLAGGNLQFSLESVDVMERYMRALFAAVRSHAGHPHLVRLFECFETRSPFTKVMEYCPGGTLTPRQPPRPRRQANAAVIHQQIV
ncbi:hypothetical protein DFJ74DRAFT_387550 [Hyaloraphidium curvatum]|nr:hypothetical protein DFJ74DRAFT_387550 [Hyaloraphidium curvatum]